MITEICMQNVASYKGRTFIRTDKKVNLIYGLNGTGKSTISSFLREQQDPKFKDCSINKNNPNAKILVYNTAFIRENFHESESLPGIFTLSKENKKAEQRILKYRSELSKLETELSAARAQQASINGRAEQSILEAQNTVWEVKKKYAGGDRVLEYCLEGSRGNKEMLFRRVAGIEKPSEEPSYKIDDLKEEVTRIQDRAGQPLPLTPQLSLNTSKVESNPAFAKSLVGSQELNISRLIQELNNSDWVKQGRQYLPDASVDGPTECPFCQSKTITEHLLKQLDSYFDQSYSEAFDSIQSDYEVYESERARMPSEADMLTDFPDPHLASEFKASYQSLLRILETNIGMIQNKIEHPSEEIILKSSLADVNACNSIIDKSNANTSAFNEKIKNGDKRLEEIKKLFWERTRWDYDQTITMADTQKQTHERDLRKTNQEISQIEIKIQETEKLIQAEQKNTVNVDEAVQNINKGLQEIGIDDFFIEKDPENDGHYRLVRQGQANNTFETLSEGEKTLISFMYFRELCEGQSAPDEVINDRLVFIDDPISSLSHIHIFNLGQLIRRSFFESEKYRQVWVLTHSLYFFYELTDTNRDRRKKNQELFRLSKNRSGTAATGMKYEEIQNDYQAYWSIIRDESQAPALIANCMRNIIEYFFGFVEKTDVNSTFQKKELQAAKFKAFYRYMNRESHSIGQNIFDIKEFDYATFKEAFRKVFEVSGYQNHYDKMIK